MTIAVDWDVKHQIKQNKTALAGHCIGLDKQFFEHKIVNMFLSVSFNIGFGCSKEPSH